MQISENEWIVNHEIYGKVVLNTKTQLYKYIETEGNRTFKYNGKECPFFDSIFDFVSAEVRFGVIPVVCTLSKQVKRRMLINLVDASNNLYNFFNVELIDGWWKKNNLEGIYNSKCYFVIVERNKQGLNNCMLVSSLEIEKGMLSEGTP